MRYFDIEGNHILKDTVYSDKKHYYLLRQTNPVLFIRDDGEIIFLDPDYTHSFLVRQDVSEIPEKVTHLRNQTSFLERYLEQSQPKCTDSNVQPGFKLDMSQVRRDLIASERASSVEISKRASAVIRQL